MGLLAVLFSCNGENLNDDRNVNSVKKLTIEEYGKIHNESIVFLVNLDGISGDNKFKLLYDEMNLNYPNIFSENLLDDVNYTIKKSTYNLSDINAKENVAFEFNTLYSQLKSEAISNGASTNLINFYDDMYDNFLQLNKSGNINKENIKNYKNNLDENEKINVDIFNSIYNASHNYWTSEAPSPYKITVIQKDCDPAMQMAFADAIAGGLLSLFTGPVGPLGGGAVSMLVRQQQIDNYDRCI